MDRFYNRYPLIATQSADPASHANGFYEFTQIDL